MLKRSAFVTVAASVAGTALLCDAWFDLVTAQPGRDDMDQTIQEQLIVEFYSR